MNATGDLLKDIPRGKYRAIVIDPPWKLVMGTKTRPQHYPRMKDEEIAALDLGSLADPEGAWLFAWVTPIMLDRFWTKILPAWKAQGWSFSSRGFLWVKTNADGSFSHGTGHTTQKNPEDCYLFRIGRPERRRGVKELIISPRREHSRKPDELYAGVEAYCDGPYLDIFSREDRAGWDSCGDEKGKFNSPDNRLCLAPRAPSVRPLATKKPSGIQERPTDHYGRQRART